MAIQTVTRDLWLWMLNEGGQYTVAQIATQMDWDINETIVRLNSMYRNRTVDRIEPTGDQRRIRWTVNGLCAVPSGMRVAEVQV